MRRDEIPIPNPCSADWGAMLPRDRARFCAACSVEVVDVSAHTEAETRALLTSREEGRLCISYAVRPDGSVRLAGEPRSRPAPTTPDVPVDALRRRSRALIVAASIALAACEEPRRVGKVAPPIPVAATSSASSGTETVEPCDPQTDEMRMQGEYVETPRPPAAVDAGAASE